ncbi:unnamed protein product, partial [Mesorhabditis spiculigera]
MLRFFATVFILAITSAVPFIEPPNRLTKKLSELEARQAWKDLGAGDAVCIDIDETLRKDNVFQELGRWMGMFEVVNSITLLPHNATFTHADAMRMRLEIMNVTREQYEQFLELQLNTTQANLAPGAIDLIAALRKKGVDVYLVGGGFRENTNNLADYLGIPRDHTFSHDLIFDEHGHYKELDVSGVSDGQGHHGKSNVLRVMKAARGIRKLAMIGDATIDMVACLPADLCIWYGRFNKDLLAQAVADWNLLDMEELTNAL